MENTYTTGSLLDRPAWNQWNLVVEQLMRRCLSVEGDKLLAVSAVAVYIYRLFESRDEARVYLAGLFRGPRALRYLRCPSSFRLQKPTTAKDDAQP